VTLGLRAEAMERRVLRTAAALGMSQEALDRLSDAFRLGMAPRVARGLDDHHPDFLHPSRTALILMDDARASDTGVLEAALVTETRDAGLRAPDAQFRALGPEARTLATSVHGLDDSREDPLEALLALTPGALQIATAERLDHARHLHLRARTEWEPYYEVTRTAYAPAARRAHPAIAGRLEWWCATFRRRFLDS
jgi:hypothetical protein